MPLAALVLTASLTAAPYSLAASENFSVYAPTQSAADAVLRRAEALRSELGLAWLGEPLPPGEGRTLIHVRLTPAADRGRSSVIDYSGGSRSNVLWIETDSIDGEEFSSTLAHELVHCLLAARYPDGFPIWAHEGIAGQYDRGLRKSLHAETLSGFARTARWPSLERLFKQDRFDPSDRASYAAAVSLAAYLVDLRGRERLLRFAASGQRDGDWGRALQASYGLRDLTVLQMRWQTRAARDSAR
jgi:hypothetical protein